MLAARDQENLIHAHRTAAAGKPLNQGVRGLAPKTPGNVKTPFRAARNDENKPFGNQGQKTAGRDGPSKLDNNAFVTPAGPKNRAPLGFKTTNAKAQPFKTPGPLQQSGKLEKTAKRPSTIRRSGRPKITVASTEEVQATVLHTEDDDHEPEYGYAPSPPAELRDVPMEFEYDQTFPQFQGANMFRGYAEIYLSSPKDEQGMSLRLKREEEAYRSHQIEEDRMISDRASRMKTPKFLLDQEVDRQVDAMIAAGPRRKTTESKIDTMKAQSAIAALADSRMKVPSVAVKQTASSLQKVRPAVAGAFKGAAPRTSMPSPVSKNTIGFPKAKKAPSIIPLGEQMKSRKEQTSRPAPVDQSSIHPKDFKKLYGEPPVESSMWFRLREHELLEESMGNDAEDELGDNLFETNFFPTGEESGEEELFQLAMPT